MRRLLQLSALALGMALPAGARAELHVEAIPVLGADAPTGGWVELAARIDNPDAKPRRGVVTLSAGSGGSDENRLLSTAGFSVGPGHTAVLTLPVHGPGEASLAATLQLLDEKGRLLTSSDVNLSERADPMLFDIHHPSRLAAALRGTHVPIAYEQPGRGFHTPHGLTVGEPLFDPASGDPILPGRSAGYYGATLVTVSSDTLARCAGAELDALVGYVVAGGTLAVIVARPEDLRNPNLVALTGGPVRVTAPDRGTLGPLPDPAPSEAPDPDAEPDLDAPDPFGGSPPPPPGHLPKSGKGAAPHRERPKSAIAPSPQVITRLMGFQGGNLAPSAYGASASCGLGEVHLLGFDPTGAPEVDDPWVRARMIDVVRRAWDRRAALVLPHGGPAEMEGQTSPILRQLDPEDHARWAVLAAALLLLAYAVVVGPVNFRSAEKRGAPLRAFARLPVLAAGTAFAILTTGMVARGWRGRASHFTLIEIAGGQERGTARRWRGFYLPKGRALTIPTTEANGVLDVVSEPRDPEAKLSIDRDGLRLTNISPPPWQTLAVREDGFASLGAGIALVQKRDGSGAAIVNRTGRVLVGAVLSMPGTAPRYFARINDGDTVSANKGVPIGRLGTVTSAGAYRVHTFEPRLFTHDLDHDVAGLSDAWMALARAANPFVDWFPADRPVLLAQLEGGEGTTSDAGLTLTRDRTLVRVVGYGGSL